MKLCITAILKIIIEGSLDRLNDQDVFPYYDSLAEKLEISRERVFNMTKQKDLYVDSAMRIFSSLDYGFGVRKENDLRKFNSALDAFAVITSILTEQSITKADLARKLNITYVAIMKKFKQSNIGIGALSKIFTALGWELLVMPFDKSGKSFAVGEEDYSNYLYIKYLNEMTVDSLNKEMNL